MKNYLLIVLAVFATVVQAQNIDSTKSGFGFALNSEYNNQINAIEIAPTAIFFKGKHQFELGTGLNPFSLSNQRIVSGQFNYKHFPNGRDNKFNMYLMMSCDYTNQLKKTYYPTTNQYLFVSGGYGFQVRVVDGLNLGTNLNLGTFTQSMHSENPYLVQLGSPKMFDNLSMNLSFQVNISYRF